MKYLWHLVVHFFTANSRHGTHSPFVYKLADEVIYVKSSIKTKKNKQQILLDRFAAYFDVCYVTSDSERGMDKALLVSDKSWSFDQLIDFQKKFKFLVVKDIYKDRDMRLLWLSMCRDPNFIVCIDLFYYGLVFYRKEQPKGFFKLRFPYCL